MTWWAKVAQSGIKFAQCIASAVVTDHRGCREKAGTVQGCNGLRMRSGTGVDAEQTVRCAESRWRPRRWQLGT